MKPVQPSIADLVLRSEVLDAMANGAWYSAVSLHAEMPHVSPRELSRILIKLVRLEVLHRRIPQDGPTEYRRRVLEEQKRAKVALKMLVGFNERMDEIRRHDCRHETACVSEVGSIMPDALWCECPEQCEYMEAVPAHARVLHAQALTTSAMHMIGDADEEVVLVKRKKIDKRTPEQKREADRLRRAKHRAIIEAKKATRCSS
jgi:DNA-binding HxlR family transcriptional regulator